MSHCLHQFYGAIKSYQYRKLGLKLISGASLYLSQLYLLSCSITNVFFYQVCGMCGSARSGGQVIYQRSRDKTETRFGCNHEMEMRF